MSERAVENSSKMPRSGPILGLRFSLSTSPWRLGPGWAVLAGALANQTQVWNAENLLRLGGAILLADAVWGGLWRQAAPRSGTLPKRRQRCGLPYCTAESRMAALADGLQNGAAGEGSTGWQESLVLLGLTVFLSALLGRPAVALSVLVLLLSVGATIAWRRSSVPALLMALLAIASPWALGATLDWTGDAQVYFAASGANLAVGMAFTVLAWSLYRAGHVDSRAPVRLIWFGQIVVLATIVMIRVPEALAIVGALLILPCLLLSRCRHNPGEVAEVLRNCDPWWLVSMLATALAVRL